MRRRWIPQVVLGAAALAGVAVGACSSSDDGPGSGSSGTPTGTDTTPNPTGTPTSTGTIPIDDPLPPGSAPRPVKIARTTTIPGCTSFVDAAATGGDGSRASPFKTIGAAASAAAPGAIICVAQGTYPEKLTPGTKYFTLAGGFQAGQEFKVRDSAMYVSKAQGSGGSFLSIQDPGPMAGQLTAIDGFEITGYSQAIVREIYYGQKFDITNNNIHDNTCSGGGQTGAGFSLNNVSGSIKGNVFAKNSCTRGGAGSLDDTTNSNSVSFESNLVDGNSGTESQISHGGGLYLFSNKLTLSGNEFKNNTVTGWGGGLFVGANDGGGQKTTATLAWNYYHDNKAGIAGGGFFCDDAAVCLSDHEIYDKNCGGNVYLDCGPDGSGPTIAKFDHLTSINALGVGCSGGGAAVQITKANNAADSYSFTNSIFWGNAPGGDFDSSCNGASSGCTVAKVNVSYSSVQTDYKNGGLALTFGAGNVAPADPLFVDAAAGDYHLQSTHGHWTPKDYANDPNDSPALAQGDPSAAVPSNPPRAGERSELGAYGNSGEASYVK